MDLNRAFKVTAKTLFGEDIGELKDFSQYLSEVVHPYRKANSCLSGKPVYVSANYPENSKFILQEEMAKLKFEPLKSDEIKDIDSLLQAVKERTVYCGNKVFGKCEQVQNVDNCVDCAYVSDSHNIFQIRYGAHLSYMREAEYVFGSSGFPGANYSMRCINGVGAIRCVESHYCSNISDLYYAFNCVGCHDGLFVFNLRSKRNVIGNLEIQKDKYIELKKKLLSEMAELLRSKKRLPSISEILNSGISESSNHPSASCQYSKVPQKVEESFQKTSNIIFGEPLSDISSFGDWLLRGAVDVKKIKGAFGRPTYKPNCYPVLNQISEKKLVSLEEALESASKTINEKKLGELVLSDLIRYASENAYFTFEFSDGFNEDVVDTPSKFVGTNIYRCWDTTQSKYSGYSSGVVHSDFIFGGGFRILRSHFCINCFDSTNLRGCFEVDSSNNCNNCYFCHNCENLDNCMFCFNTKSKRYAICNTELTREEYLRLNRLLLDFINENLKENKKLALGIFTLG